MNEDIIKTKEFSLYQMTSDSRKDTSYDDGSFLYWQRKNPRYKVVGVTPFTKTNNVSNTTTPPINSNYSQPQNGSNLPPINVSIQIPIPTQYYDNYFLVQYMEIDLEKKASTLEKFLGNENTN